MMKPKNKVALIACSLIAITSCGDKKSSEADKNKRFGKTTIVGVKPNALTKQSTQCDNLIVLDEPYEFSIPQFLDGKLSYTQINFKDQVKDNYVKSPSSNPISQMVYGLDMEVIATYVFEDGDYKVQEGFEVNFHSEEKELKVCPGDMLYKTATYESAGLNISNTITKTHAKVSNLGYNLEPVKVNVAPIRYLDLTFVGGDASPRPKGYEADNAYYQAGINEITFLPQSEFYKKLRGSTPFWQMPMVGSHEYGHHIFNTFVVEKIDSKISFSKNCFQGHDHLYDGLESASEKRDATSDFALRSINEGFADLIAKFTLSESESSMKAIKCFEANRDASSAVFGKGDSKYFDEKVVSLIDSSDSIKPPESCDKPNFQEVHHVGASFAHGAYRIIRSFTSDNDISLKILMSFAEGLVKLHPNIKDKTPSDYLFESLSLVLSKAYEVTEASPSAYNCELLEEVFPAGDISVCEASAVNLTLEESLVKP